MVIHYKCPNCGDDMTFDSESGHLSCGACGRQDNIETFSEEFISTTFEDHEAKEYHCENCGASLITDADTAATTCSFCGAAVVLAERVSGTLAPAMVIPFSVSRDEAVKAFKKWCRNGILSPAGFMTADRIKQITGMYVPFWIYDLNSKVEVTAHATKVKSYSSGDYIVTETSHFNVYRDINLNYLKVPVDASKKMDDELMDKLEPFPYDQLKPFKTPYLAGYIAEKYNYDESELLPRVKQKIQSFIDSYIDSSISGYSSVQYRNKNINTKKVSSSYILLPVWMLYYDYNGTEYVFAMNGQTGKVVGKPPISRGKIFGWFGAIAGGTFILLKAASMLMGGGLLW